METRNVSLASSFVSGGVAGFAVDISLYPLDTIKTRLQSQKGFLASGGFRAIYSGLGPAALGSAPNAATFFVTYEGVKLLLKPYIPREYIFLSHATAASAGELVACLVRVPVEIIKQRRQTQFNSSAIVLVKSALKQEGILGLYRGYWSTVSREIPFSLLQYPLWEYFKLKWSDYQGYETTPWQSAASGSLAGGLSAAITTPLDVAKTRIMLADVHSDDSKGSIITALRNVYIERGWRGTYAGVVPRSLAMSLGGFIYFGAYDNFRTLIS